MQFTRALSYQLPLLRGEDVRAVQQALISLRVDPSCGDADGIFGAATGASVKAFQKSAADRPPAGNVALPATGIVDAPTWAALMSGADHAGAPAANVAAAVRALAPDSGPRPNPPLNEAQAGRVKLWLRANYGAQIDAAIAPLPALDSDLVCAIACKESAIYWVGKVDSIPAADILGYCVFDASGDVPGTSRSAFPRNAAEFRADPTYGDLTDMLIDEANKSRAALRKMAPATYLYKGYGIFQDDLQNIRVDEEFFRNKLWYNFDACIGRFIKEMTGKLNAAQGDLRKAVQYYNGSGKAAEQYAADVMQLRQWCATTR